MNAKQDGVPRRGFFKAAFGAAAVGAVAAGGATPTKAAESVDERKKSRYVESDHVKNFYRVNRYPAKGA